MPRLCRHLGSGATADPYRAAMRALVRRTERSGCVMGTRVHVIVIGGPPELVDDAMLRLDDLEARWSRFRPDSEISRLNAADGAPVVVSPVTYDLVSRAVAESRATGGAFDPTVLRSLVAAGYDRDFASLDPGTVASLPATPAPGVSAVVLDPIVRSIRLGPGTEIDPGGIGKGFAADLVAAELRAAGAAGVCVNLGGDLRVLGTPPDDRAWSVAIDAEPGDTSASATRGTLALSEGGVATTSARRRVWRRADGLAHHVIDPRTGDSATVPWTSVTVVAGDAASAEVGATAAFLTSDTASAAAVLRERGAVGLAFDETGRAHELGDLEPYLA